jgi:ElaB/YqjD/DUF883 family membrane-anchored ribosome-binding protein
MDQRTGALDQDLKDILHTRTAIANKLDALEQRVLHHAEDATMQLTRVLDRTTKHMNEFVDKTKAVIDPSRQVRAHPWLMVGGALCAGYALGLLERRTRHHRNGVYPYYPAGAKASPVMPSPSRRGTTSKHHDGIYDYYPDPSSPRHEPDTREDRSLWNSLSREFGPETEEAKQMVLRLGRGLIVELTRRMVPDIARALGVTLPPGATDPSRGEREASPDHRREDPSRARQGKAEEPIVRDSSTRHA